MGAAVDSDEATDDDEDPLTDREERVMMQTRRKQN